VYSTEGGELGGESSITSGSQVEKIPSGSVGSRSERSKEIERSANSRVSQKLPIDIAVNASSRRTSVEQ